MGFDYLINQILNLQMQIQMNFWQERSFYEYNL